MKKELEWVVTPQVGNARRCDSGACIALAWTQSGNVLLSVDDDNGRVMASAEEMSAFILATKAGHFDSFLIT